MKAFVSYTRGKDLYGVVRKFVDHLQNEFGFTQLGSKVFQDRNDISPGMNISEAIKRALDDADVLLVLVSPAWLKTTWCQDEFNWFMAKKTPTGENRCVLPVLWVDTPGISSPEDSSMAITPQEKSIAEQIKKILYADWSELRLQGWDVPETAIAIAHLAKDAIKLSTKQQREASMI